MNMTALLEEQLASNTEELKEFMNQEVSSVKAMTEHIKSTLLPNNIKKVEELLAEGQQKQQRALDDCLEFVRSNIKFFAEKVEYFELETGAIMRKFKRIVADQDIFKARVMKTQKRTREMVTVMRAEQLAVSKIASTLVELEFIQQSLDFQDEFDKTQMHLYGLNDLNMTLEDFISKSTEIA